MLAHVEHGCCGVGRRHVDRAVAVFVPAKQSCLREGARRRILDGEWGVGDDEEEEVYYCRWCDGGFERLSGLFAHRDDGGCARGAVVHEEVVKEALERVVEMTTEANGITIEVT